jgi:hypothetical protein
MAAGGLVGASRASRGCTATSISWSFVAGFPARRGRPFAALPGSAMETPPHDTGHGSAFQISELYCEIVRSLPARCPYLYRQQPIARPASLILGTLFSQMTIESTSRDPSPAAELTRLHAASCKLRDNLPNLFPCPSFRGGYVRLMIHSRISARTLSV